MLKEFSNTASFFPASLRGFEKSAIIAGQELLLNQILNECLVSEDLQITRKKSAPL